MIYNFVNSIQNVLTMSNVTKIHEKKSSSYIIVYCLFNHYYSYIFLVFKFENKSSGLN